MISFLPVLALGFALNLYMAYTARRRSLLLLEVADGDEDIKIAPGSFSQSRGEDGAELAARDFLKQRDCGNIDRARDLGVRYAQALLRAADGPLVSEADGKPPAMQHQIYILYAFVVSHVIADHSPNSILAQTSQSVFQSEVEENSPEMAEHISDSAAFSLYILNERSPSHADEIGRIFAGLVGEETNEALAGYGNRLYDQFYRFCVGEISKIKYIEV